MGNHTPTHQTTDLSYLFALSLLDRNKVGQGDLKHPSVVRQTWRLGGVGSFSLRNSCLI